MPTRINVIHKPDDPYACELRELFCVESVKEPKRGRNPLTDTNFNELLDKVVQMAFDAGVRFAKQHPTLEV